MQNTFNVQKTSSDGNYFDLKQACLIKCNKKGKVIMWNSLQNPLGKSTADIICWLLVNVKYICTDNQA